jgi:protein gp37
LWELIQQTPMLDWLLLTKRPQNISRMVPWSNDSWPDNVWLVTTVENQNWAEQRLPLLVENNAKVKFLSCEPLLSEIDLKKWIENGLIDWVIAGGESVFFDLIKIRTRLLIWKSPERSQCLANRFKDELGYRYSQSTSNSEKLFTALSKVCVLAATDFFATSEATCSGRSPFLRLR